MVQVDHPLMAGQFAVQRDEAVALAEHAQRAVVDQHFALGEAVADRLHVLQVAGVQVAVLELADGLQRFQSGDALFQGHSGVLSRLSSPQ
ncbi:hypothetical protein D3C80_1690900 [compost metagenome]